MGAIVSIAIVSIDISMGAWVPPPPTLTQTMATTPWPSPWPHLLRPSSLWRRYAAKYPTRFKVWYTLDRPPASWKFSSGFISDSMIAEHLPGPQEASLVLMCGPPPMLKFACLPNLTKLGYTKAQQVVF